jgi:hypothetical protein
MRDHSTLQGVSYMYFNQSPGFSLFRTASLLRLYTTFILQALKLKACSGFKINKAQTGLKPLHVRHTKVLQGKHTSTSTRIHKHVNTFVHAYAYTTTHTKTHAPWSIRELMWWGGRHVRAAPPEWSQKHRTDLHKFERGNKLQVQRGKAATHDMHKLFQKLVPKASARVAQKQILRQT